MSQGRAEAAPGPCVVEASAPCRVDLAGGALEAWPLYLFHPEAVAICVAIDRRVSCRVETGVEGVEIESRDSLSKLGARTVSALLAENGSDLAGQVLRALGVESGVRVTTHARVPAGSGLGGSQALAVALTAAVARASGQELGPERIVTLSRDAETRVRKVPGGLRGYHTALRGGVVAMGLDPGGITVERPTVDPGRVEESLLLVDAGLEPAGGSGDWITIKGQLDGDPAVRRALAAIASLTERLRSALVAGQGEELVRLRGQEWEAVKELGAGRSSAAVDRVVQIVGQAGGAGQGCDGGSMVAVWAPPGERGPGKREAVLAALRASGLRQTPARVDLRGLEVEEVAGRAL